jgi:hypothetical protein
MDVIAALLPPAVVAAAFIAIAIAIKKRLEAESREDGEERSRDENPNDTGNSGR